MLAASIPIVSYDNTLMDVGPAAQSDIMWNFHLWRNLCSYIVFQMDNLHFMGKTQMRESLDYIFH